MVDLKKLTLDKQKSNELWIMQQMENSQDYYSVQAETTILAQTMQYDSHGMIKSKAMPLQSEAL